MTFFYNSAIIAFKRKKVENFTLAYRLFENGDPYTYSLLITMSGENEQQDFYIPELAASKEEAVSIFEKMHENLVLPSELPVLFAEDAFQR